MVVAVWVAVAIAAMLVGPRVPMLVHVVAIMPAIASCESDRRQYEENSGRSMKYFHRFHFHRLSV
ncbi:MAG: hypothetical protein ABSF94_06585 [Steroidobacteraceae bacterium]|jgi:hypothetical protein